MKTAVFSVLLICAGAVSVAATSVRDTHVVPVAGHVRGANETWVTAVTVHNPGPETLIVDLAAIAGDGAPVELQTDMVTVGPNGTVTLRDLVRPGGVGALIAAGNAPFAISTRVYAERTHGAVGSEITAADVFLDSDSSGAVLPGLVANARSRTNIGLFALADQTPLDIEVSLFDGAGTPIGSRTLRLQPGQTSHVQFSSTAISAAPFDLGTAHVRVAGGDGVVTPYASVIDNGSSDAGFVAPVLLDGHQANSARHRLLVRRHAAGAIE